MIADTPGKRKMISTTKTPVTSEAAAERAREPNALKEALAITAEGGDQQQQVTDRAIEKRKEYKTLVTEGAIIGVVNGLAWTGIGGDVLQHPLPIGLVHVETVLAQQRFDLVLKRDG